jgi:glycosyltransferase involved in cell wall biosynthesis
MPQLSPLFSIVIPTYNRAHLIGKTIQTVLAQDFSDFEVLVIDDGSKDNTAAVMEAFTDPRIQYIKKENGERGAARNYGAARARGRYINFFDSDDLMYPNHLQVANRLIAAQADPEIFHLAYDYQLDDGTVISRVNDFDARIKEIILFNNKLSCNGVFIRKDIAAQFPFEEDRALASSEDWVLWIRLLCRFTLHCSNDITSSVVNHDQRSLRTIAAAKVEARDQLMIDVLRRDTVVMNAYGTSFRRFMAERYTFFMLCFSEEHNSARVRYWANQAWRIYLPIIGSKRFLASIKNSILNR